MTLEEITATLQTVAGNQAKHDEMHARHSTHMAEMESMQARHSANMAKIEEMSVRHSADIAEIDEMIAAGVESQNRFDRQLTRLYEVVSDLADKHLKNEERFA